VSVTQQTESHTAWFMKKILINFEINVAISYQHSLMVSKMFYRYVLHSILVHKWLKCLQPTSHIWDETSVPYCLYEVQIYTKSCTKQVNISMNSTEINSVKVWYIFLIFNTMAPPAQQSACLLSRSENDWILRLTNYTFYSKKVLQYLHQKTKRDWKITLHATASQPKNIICKEAVVLDLKISSSKLPDSPGSIGT